jgi:hypothetical protein
MYVELQPKYVDIRDTHSKRKEARENVLTGRFKGGACY